MQDGGVSIFESRDLTLVLPPALWAPVRGGEMGDVVLLPDQKSQTYWIGFACSPKALEKAFRLRYEVFNLELGEGLQESHLTGLDRDQFDEQMTHLVLIEKATCDVVGTYRLQTVRNGLARKGIYAGIEYDLSPLEPWFDNLVECGRACIGRKHRSFKTLYLLWAGIAGFLNLERQTRLFGCCSLTTTDPDQGWRAMKTIRDQRYLHPEILIRPWNENSCGPRDREFAPDLGEALPLPKLFSAYMMLGAQVISEPALDRQFQTVDFLVALDGRHVHMSSLDLLR